MSNNKVYQFCGIDIFEWDEWEQVDVDTLQFYNVKFLMCSMKKFDGKTVTKSLDGSLKIYDEKGLLIWDGWTTDIPEVIDQLDLRK